MKIGYYFGCKKGVKYVEELPENEQLLDPFSFMVEFPYSKNGVYTRLEHKDAKMFNLIQSIYGIQQ